MIRATFADTASRDAFASRFKLTQKVGENQLDFNWHLLQFAKLDTKCTDYEELAVLQAGPSAATEKEFVVKGDPAIFNPHVTSVVADLGNGFYHIKTTNPLTLADHVASIEHTGAPMTLMGSINGMTGTSTALDPTSSQAQWPRIRVASRYRPLLDSYSTHEMNYKSKPELYIMDTGIDFTHPEFNYTGFEGVNFYTCFPGNFADDVGHGTAVTSLAVGKNLGIANNCKVLNVKMGSSSGSASILQVGQAIDAIVAAAAADPLKTRIVNMSWGTARSEYLDAKVQGLLDLGITVICAAGNDGIDVADVSPAGMVEVITVAAMDQYDIPCGFNNISPSDAGVTTGSGQELDLFAPGENMYVANMHTGGYVIDSGTSFSAPLVAGIAAEIGALFDTIVPFSQMKNTIISTATENALLFEDTTFSENQNKIAFIFTSDPNANYKSNNMTMYLGTHPDSGEPIVADLNSAVDVMTMQKVFPDNPITWSIQWDDPALEATYAPFLSLNASTGMLSINKPTTTLPAETKLKMVEFTAVATNGVAKKMTSPALFFFDFNPAYNETKDSDITLALTETNSISFYGYWNIFIK